MQLIAMQPIRRKNPPPGELAAIQAGATFNIDDPDEARALLEAGQAREPTEAERQADPPAPPGGVKPAGGDVQLLQQQAAAQGAEEARRKAEAAGEDAVSGRPHVADTAPESGEVVEIDGGNTIAGVTTSGDSLAGQGDDSLAGQGDDSLAGQGDDSLAPHRGV